MGVFQCKINIESSLNDVQSASVYLATLVKTEGANQYVAGGTSRVHSMVRSTYCIAVQSKRDVELLTH